MAHTSARTGKVLLVALILLSPLAIVLTAPSAAAASAPFAWGSDVSQWESYIDAERAAAISVSRATGMTLIGTDAKDAGPVGWASPTYTTLTTFAKGDGGVERMTRDAHANGLRVLARFDVFQDSVAAKRFPAANMGGSPPWVDPGCADVRAYALAQVKELVTLVPIDELNLDHIRYPDASESTMKPPCTPEGADRSAIIASWVKDASAAARAIRPGIVVSIDVFAYTMKGAMPEIGQDAARLAPSVDILRPMLYPSYDPKAAEADPYASVKGYATLGVGSFGAAKVQPWIQGFGPYATRPDLVCAQYKALADAGASGGVVWWFETAGTSRTFWDKVAPCVPAAAPAPAPAPAPEPAPAPAPAPATVSSSFAVTFEPKPGNNWWVETKATSAQTIAGVSASVNGGAPVALAKNQWGAWSKSFYVPTGATLKFTAVSSTGATNVSASYRWPTATLVSSPTPTPAPTPSVTFTPKNGNEWWVQVAVSGSPIKVEAMDTGGPWTALALRSWGDWATSFRVETGHLVQYRATFANGTVAQSCAFTHPSATCARATI